MCERAHALRAAALGLATLLPAGCGDERQIVEFWGIEITEAYDDAVFQPGVMAAELHNAPIEGMSREEAVALIALPEGLGEGVDLPLVDPGGWARAEHGRPVRLAVLFNPARDFPGATLCAAPSPLEGRPAGVEETGYIAAMALCVRDMALASGRLRAERGEPVDGAFVRETLGALMREAFGHRAAQADGGA